MLLTGQLEVISNAKLQVEEDSVSCAERYLESKSPQLLAMTDQEAMRFLADVKSKCEKMDKASTIL